MRLSKHEFFRKCSSSFMWFQEVSSDRGSHKWKQNRCYWRSTKLHINNSQHKSPKHTVNTKAGYTHRSHVMHATENIISITMYQCVIHASLASLQDSRSLNHHMHTMRYKVNCTAIGIPVQNGAKENNKQHQNTIKITFFQGIEGFEQYAKKNWPFCSALHDGNIHLLFSFMKFTALANGLKATLIRISE